MRRQVGLLPPGAREFMESAKTPPVERLLMASQLAGLTYEADFWRLARKVLNRKESSLPLDPRFDLLLDAESYRKMEREKMLLRESRAGVNRDTVILKALQFVVAYNLTSIHAQYFSQQVRRVVERKEHIVEGLRKGI